MMKGDFVLITTRLVSFSVLSIFFLPQSLIAKTISFEDLSDGEYEQILYEGASVYLSDDYSGGSPRDISVEGGSLVIDERIDLLFPYLTVEFDNPVKNLDVSVSGLLFEIWIYTEGAEFASRYSPRLGGYFPDDGGGYIFEYGSATFNDVGAGTEPIDKLIIGGYAPENDDPDFPGTYRYALDSIEFDPVGVSPVPLPSSAVLLGGILGLFGTVGMRRKRRSITL